MQLHFEHYLKELCDIYIDVLGKCQYSGFAGYVEELEQRKKGISFSIKSNFKEILSSLPYVQKVESLNKRFPGFKYLTDVFFNDEDSFSQLSQARLNFHSMEFIVGENERRKVFTIDKKTTFICYLLSFFANHAKLKDSKNILDVIDKLKSSILQEGENATLISDLLKSAFSIYFRFPPLKKRALLLYLDLIKFLGENPLTSQSVVNNILNKKVIIQYKKGTISLKELFFLLTKTNQNVKEKSYLNLLRQSLIKEGIINETNNNIFINEKYLFVSNEVIIKFLDTKK